MTYTERSEKPHGAQYHSIPCGMCGSRRTERIGPLRRVCHVCGIEGILKLKMEGRNYTVALEAVR